MKLDITKGIQSKGYDVPFELTDAWGEDHWNGDTVAYVRPVSFSGTYMLADETVIVRGVARAQIESPCARCLKATETELEAEVSEAVPHLSVSVMRDLSKNTPLLSPDRSMPVFSRTPKFLMYS